MRQFGARGGSVARCQGVPTAVASAAAAAAGADAASSRQQTESLSETRMVSVPPPDAPGEGVIAVQSIRP